MPENYNIITKKVPIVTQDGAAVAIGSSVAAGMKRYVTFVRVDPRNMSSKKGSKVWICSTSTAVKASSTTTASAAAKMLLMIPSAVGAQKFAQVPDYPDSENPLFTIAASRFLTARISKLQLGSASVTLFVQYYDQ